MLVMSNFFWNQFFILNHECKELIYVKILIFKIKYVSCAHSLRFMVFILVRWVIHCLLIFLSVAFFILFERKIISLFHNRIGPNKVSFIGFVQTLLDAFKFFLKQNILPLTSNFILFSIAPLIGLLIACLIWIRLPSLFFLFSINYSFLLFFCLGSIIVLSVLLAGWSSNSKYRLIGRLRSVAQSISYEAVFRTLIMLVIFVINSYSIRSSINMRRVLFFRFFPIWFICILAETHRAPFDFRESESELVSGYNTEYSRVNFAFVLLSEYIVVLFSCILISLLFFNWFFFLYYYFFVIVTRLLLLFLVTWVRITFCRFRYDLLIIIAWKIFLPFCLVIFILSLLVHF